MPRLFALATTIAAMLFAGLGPASASTYQVTFVSSPFDVSALINVNGTNDVTSISGSVTGVNGAPISGLNPGVPGTWDSDNKFYAAADPVVTNPGILFDAGAWIYNLYSVGTTYYLSTFNPDGTWYNPGALGVLTVSEVPVPPALLLFGSALVGLGLLRRKSRKTTASGPAFV